MVTKARCSAIFTVSLCSFYSKLGPHTALASKDATGFILFQVDLQSPSTCMIPNGKQKGFRKQKYNSVEIVIQITPITSKKESYGLKSKH